MPGWHYCGLRWFRSFRASSFLLFSQEKRTKEKAATDFRLKSPAILVIGEVDTEQAEALLAVNG